MARLVEFLRNQILDARTFFTLPTPANPTAKKPPLRQNQFGVEFDGPVVIPKLYNGKDKTFFMASYEGYRLSAAVDFALHANAGGFLQRQFLGGARSQHYGRRIKDPLNGNAPFPGNIIPRPGSRPSSQNCSSTTRRQTSPAWPAISPCRCRPPPATTRPWTASTRTSATRSGSMCAPTGRNGTRSAGNAIPVNGTTTPTTVTNYTVGYTHTLTPNLVNDFRVGRNFFNTATLNPFSVGGQYHRRHGPGNPGLQRRLEYNNPGIPDFNITGFNGFGNAGTNWYQNDSTHQLSEQISWNHGSHNIMAGVGIPPAGHRAGRRQQRARHFTFNGTQTGYAPADFILGTPGQLRHGRPGNPRTGRRMARRLLRARQVAGLAQTDAQLRPPLRTAHGALHDQRRRQHPECRPNAL